MRGRSRPRAARPAIVALLAAALSSCGGADDARQTPPASASAEATGDDAPSGAAADRPETPTGKRRLGPGVNTPYAEILPIALASGDTLYFTRSGYPDPTVRALLTTMMDERIEACRNVDGGEVLDMADSLGVELDPEMREMLAEAGSGCGELEREREELVYDFERSPHPNQVYVSVRGADGTWSEAERLPPPLNDESPTNLGHMAITSASPDRRTLLVWGNLIFGGRQPGRCGDAADALWEGTVECLPLAIARRAGDGWNRDLRLRTEPYPLMLLVTGAALSPDGRTVVLSARDADTRIDNHDRLFVTRWDEARRLWTAPEEIPGLAGPFDTVTPFIGPDGRSLYFASDRPGGLGGLDLYLVRRLDESWLRWSDPENLGAPINSEADDLSISVDATGRLAFMASGAGEQLDIYEFDLPPNLSPAPTALVGGRILRGGRLPDGPPVEMRAVGEGELLFPAGGGGAGGGGGDGAAPDEGVVVFVRLSDARVAGQAGFDPGTGSFVTRLPVGERYGAYVSVPGFAGIGEIVDLTNARANQRIERDLAITRLEEGATIRLENVFFETDSSELLDESRAELDRLVWILRRHPGMRIEIAGHTDSRDTEAYNVALSDRRAASVRSYLEAAGVSPERLASRGYGESSPIASNETEEGRALNRRVEFRILAMD